MTFGCEGIHGFPVSVLAVLTFGCEGIHGFPVSVCVGISGGLLSGHGFGVPSGFGFHGLPVALVARLAGLGHLVDAPGDDTDLKDADHAADGDESCSNEDEREGDADQIAGCDCDSRLGIGQGKFADVGEQHVEYVFSPLAAGFQ